MPHNRDGTGISLVRIANSKCPHIFRHFSLFLLPRPIVLVGLIFHFCSFSTFAIFNTFHQQNDNENYQKHKNAQELMENLRLVLLENLKHIACDVVMHSQWKQPGPHRDILPLSLILSSAITFSRSTLRGRTDQHIVFGNGALNIFRFGSSRKSLNWHSQRPEVVSSGTQRR